MRNRRRRRASLSPATLQGGFWCLAAGLALGLAFWSEHVEGAAPCALCLWERWPYRVLAGLGLLWFGIGLVRLNSPRWLSALVSLTLLAAFGLGLTHVGVEQGWWPSPLPECAAPHFSGGSIAERLASMPLRPSKPCDSPNRLFDQVPLSMAMLDALYALGLLVVSRVMAPRRR